MEASIKQVRKQNYTKLTDYIQNIIIKIIFDNASLLMRRMELFFRNNTSLNWDSN